MSGQTIIYPTSLIHGGEHLCATGYIPNDATGLNFLPLPMVIDPVTSIFSPIINVVGYRSFYITVKVNNDAAITGLNLYWNFLHPTTFAVVHRIEASDWITDDLKKPSGAGVYWAPPTTIWPYLGDSKFDTMPWQYMKLELRNTDPGASHTITLLECDGITLGGF